MSSSPEEYGRDRENRRPRWVEIRTQSTVLKFIKHGKGVRASSRRSLSGSRRHRGAYVPDSAFMACCRLAQAILHPRPQFVPRPHWMDDRDD